MTERHGHETPTLGAVTALRFADEPLMLGESSNITLVDSVFAIALPCAADYPAEVTDER